MCLGRWKNTKKMKYFITCTSYNTLQANLRLWISAKSKKTILMGRPGNGLYNSFVLIIFQHWLLRLSIPYKKLDNKCSSVSFFVMSRRMQTVDLNYKKSIVLVIPGYHSTKCKFPIVIGPLQPTNLNPLIQYCYNIKQ